MTSERTLKLKTVRDEVIGLTASPLYDYRTSRGYFPVIGEGNHEAKIMFVGEAPGQNEAKTGRPFCGAAGRILDELLNSINLPRGEVYVTNILKDRPPENRDPLPAEIAVYGPFLDRQIEIIRPAVIATLGRYSMKYLMEKLGLADVLRPISQLHGQLFETAAAYGPVKVVPLYHPAVAIYNRETLAELKKDFQVLKNYAA